jgi:hypothetical protein
MTLHPIPFEFPYIWGKFSFLFISVLEFIYLKKSKPVKMCFEYMMAQLESAVGCKRRLKAAQRHRQTRVATSRINQELAARLTLT